jgi:hypothetical protein
MSRGLWSPTPIILVHMFPARSTALDPRLAPATGRKADGILSIKDAVQDYVARYDPALLARATLELEQQRVGEVIKMLTVLQALNAARLASFGDKDQREEAKRQLARSSGTTIREAERAIATGRALSNHPDLDRAARAGLLSANQMGIIAEAASESPEATTRLLAMAERSSVRELSEEAARLVAAGPHGMDRHRAIHAGRYLRYNTGADGAFYLHARGTPEDGARIISALRPFSDQAFNTARRDGRHEGPEAYAFDGLVGLAQAQPGPDGKRPRDGIFIHLDHDVLIRGYALAGEVCRVEGFGAVPPQVVADMLETGDPFLRAIITKGQDVAGVVHLGRRPRRAQQSALDWLYPQCAAAGCATRACWLQTDHRLDWAKTRYTILDLLDRLCPHHHRLKTYKGWALVEGKGKRPFVPPEDPRHPHWSRSPLYPPPPPTMDPESTAPSPSDEIPANAVEPAISPLPSWGYGDQGGLDFAAGPTPPTASIDTEGGAGMEDVEYAQYGRGQRGRENSDLIARTPSAERDTGKAAGYVPSADDPTPSGPPRRPLPVEPGPSPSNRGPRPDRL